MAAQSPSAPVRISETFARAKREGRTAFMPFITAGDPDLEGTRALVRRLSETGVDLIEVGFPYSDPIADGPVIQASYTRSLSRRITLDAIFAAFGSLDRQGLAPLVAMASYALLMRRGVERFLADAAQAGFSGLIIPDLPAAEADDVFRMAHASGLDLIQLIAPTTDRARVPSILKSCSGFVYCLAVAGITGERESVADELIQQLRWLKSQTELPLAAGFGISRPEHVATLRGVADGVIVGSAIVRRLESAEGAPFDAVLDSVGQFSGEMVAACAR
ncbi:MAG: tryptophan synthase subunit alpha [Planctomyces sp.]|nr:tryptophan synthase subunit alpha [Planctomyces sp.]